MSPNTRREVNQIIIISVLGIALVILLGSFYSADSKYEKTLANLRVEKARIENELKACNAILDVRGKPPEPGSLLAQVRDLGKSLKDEGDRAIAFLEDMSGFMKELPCRWDMSDWVARVEGAADLPQGMFWLIIKAEKKGETMPKLTRRQKKSLAKAIDENPLPKKECKEKKENGQTSDNG